MENIIKARVHDESNVEIIANFTENVLGQSWSIGAKEIADQEKKKLLSHLRLVK